MLTGTYTRRAMDLTVAVSGNLGCGGLVPGPGQFTINAMLVPDQFGLTHAVVGMAVAGAL